METKIVWKPMTQEPTESCKIILVGESNNITTGHYNRKERKYNINDPSIKPTHWIKHYDDLHEMVMFDPSSFRILEILNPKTDKLMAFIGAFGLSMKYNFSQIKTEEDVVEVADAIGQYFYDSILNTLDKISDK